jgi:hypothetical protein
VRGVACNISLQVIPLGTHACLRQKADNENWSLCRRVACEGSVGLRQTPIRTLRYLSVDFSKQLDSLEQHASAAKNAAHAAVTETHDKLEQRIDEAQIQMRLGIDDAQHRADQAGSNAQSKWAHMKADAAARMDEAKSRVDKRLENLDASAAAKEAEMAESEASDAIAFAEWAVDNARYVVLSAIDARVYADERAATATHA